MAIAEYIRGVEHSSKRVHSVLVASNFQLSLEGHEPPVIPPLKENQISRKKENNFYRQNESVESLRGIQRRKCSHRGQNNFCNNHEYCSLRPYFP